MSAPVFSATCHTSVGEVGVSMEKVSTSEFQFGKSIGPSTPGGTGMEVRLPPPRLRMKSLL